MINDVINILGHRRLPLSTEQELQDAVEGMLRKHDIPYEREVKLSEHDRIDFMVFDMGIEIKIKGSAKSIYRQCERYCGFEEVGSLLLLTNRSMGFPEEIGGTSCYLLNLGKSWL